MSNCGAIVAGVAFVMVAAANVVVMLEASQPSRSATTRSRLIVLHRAGGYLFVILFCITAYSMTQRLAGLGITGHLPTHLVLAHCARASSHPSASAENIDCTPLQTEP